jgi:hypothetical protein
MAPACWLLGRNAFALKRGVHLNNSKGEGNNFQGLSLYQGMTGVLEFKYPSERGDEMHSNMPGKTE